MTQCGLMGLAYVAAACTDDKPCAINEDSGLILGIVVAHEMGHVYVYFKKIKFSCTSCYFIEWDPHMIKKAIQNAKPKPRINRII